MASMQSPDINLIHFILRLLVALGSFLSAMFKIPFIIYAFKFVIEFVLKINKGESSPGGDSSDEPKDLDQPKQIDLPMLEVALNAILLISLFIAVMVVLIRAVYTITLGRLINVYSYLIVMGLWITFILIATMTAGWKGPLNYAILAARIVLVGWYAIKAPPTWEFILLRSSLIVDLLTYPAMIGLAILNIKYTFLNDLPMLEVALNAILLISLFIAVMVVLIRAVYTITLGRLINVYSYLIVMGLWITFILIATMNAGWKGPLNYAILAA